MIDFSAENSLVGSVLVEPNVLQSVLEFARPADFVSSICRATMEAAVKISAKGIAADPVMIRAELEAGGYDESTVNGFLVGCMESTPTAANAVEYAKIVKSQSMARKLSAISEEIQNRCMVGGDWQTVAADGVHEINKLCADDVHTDFVGGEGWMESWLDDEEETMKDPERAFCRSRYNSLDFTLGGGLFKSGMYVIGARPGMGKTTLGINIAERVASYDKRVLFISLEMSPRQIMCKRIANFSGIPYNALMTGRLNAEQRTQMMDTADQIGKRNFAVNCKTGLTVADIALLVQKCGDVDLLVVDYLGLIKPSKTTGNRYEDYTNISGELKQMAARLDIPVIVLSQLNRANTGRTDKRPTLSDLRDTGAVEQDADCVILLHREDYYSRAEGESNKENEEIELIIAKNRHGNTGTVRMMWQGETGRIAEPPTIGGYINQDELPF